MTVRNIFSAVVVAAAVMVAGAAIPGVSHSGTRRSDTPEKGVWDFAPVPVWSFDHTGADTLGRIAEPRVSGDGRLYFHDFDRHISYILDENGALVSTFARAGEGPGYVSRYINCFTLDAGVVVGSMDKLHFFDKNGLFIKSVPNNIFESFPLVFTGGDVMYTAPGALVNLPGGKAAIRRIDTASGEAKIMHEYTLAEDERINFGGVIIGLIPQIKMDYDTQNGNLFFGRSDSYEIMAADKDGKITGSFGLDRERKPVTEDELRLHFAGSGIPADRAEKIIPLLPRKLTYFHRIQVIDGLVYVFTVDALKSGIGRQDVDIFSSEGEYLYRGKIVMPGNDRYKNLDQMALSKGFLHAILTDEGGASRVVKYRVSMPGGKSR